MDKFEESFIHSLNDLREKILSNNRYQLIKASGILRLLLTDHLIHKANRKHQVKFQFYLTLNDFRKPGTRSLNLKEFLATEWKAYREHTYSIKEIIDVSAHLMGGVHIQEPKDKKEIDIIDIFEHRPITYDTIKSSLVGISNLTIEGLKELEDKIKQNDKT